MLAKAYTRRIAVRLVGIKLTNFSNYSEQEELFEWIEIKRRRMLKVVNRIRNKYGYDSILIGELKRIKETHKKPNYFQI